MLFGGSGLLVMAAVFSMLASTTEARFVSGFSVSLPMSCWSDGMLLVVGMAGRLGGKGKASCFSLLAVGVGDSIAFRALSLSAAIRELSRTSPPRLDK